MWSLGARAYGVFGLVDAPEVADLNVQGTVRAMGSFLGLGVEVSAVIGNECYQPIPILISFQEGPGENVETVNEFFGRCEGFGAVGLGAV